MMGVAVTSHTIGAAVFSLTTLVLLQHRITRAEAPTLIIACFITAVWAFLSASYAANILYHYPAVAISEVLRNITWAFCVTQLIYVSQQKHQLFPVKIPVLNFKVFLLGLGILLSFTSLYIKSRWQPGSSGIYAKYTFVGQIVLAACILGLLEQLYRGNVPEQRFKMRFLCLGLGALFLYDFYMYANGIIFNGISRTLWEVRGATCALIAPLILLSALRINKWRSDIAPSRTLLMHTTVFIGCVVYVLMTAMFAWYVRQIGGTHGAALQNIVVFAACLFLGILFFSGKVRSSASLLLAKHFFKFRYDYRYEWERLTKLLTNNNNFLSLEQRMIKALAELTESPKGVLYQIKNNHLTASCGLNVNIDKCTQVLPDVCMQFILKHHTPCMISEIVHMDRACAHAFEATTNAWLIVPLIHNGQAIGVVVLAKPLVDFAVNWEVKDFLSLAGLQIAVGLVQANDAKALAVAQKFEAISQVSAFVVHDIKNVISQLKVIESNRAQHQHNPDFIQSVFKTVNASSKRLEKLYQRVQGNTICTKPTEHMFWLREAITETIKLTKNNTPALKAFGVDTISGIQLQGDQESFTNCLTHLVTNAQQATPDDGEVKLQVVVDPKKITITLSDTGVGMTNEFIQYGLFEPFVSTKGDHNMGIGVYQSKKLIESMQGDLTVTSQLKQGTTFHISLPRVKVLESRGVCNE